MCGLVTPENDNREGKDAPTSSTRSAVEIIFM